MGRHEPAPFPVITAGEAVRETWCNTCQEPWRVRVPLFANGQPCGALEVCYGCGSGHDQVGVYITDASEPSEPAPPRGTTINRGFLSPVRLAHALHGWRCRKRNLKALDCAYGDCPWPGLWRHVLELDGDEGTWRYLFCRKAHRTRWAAGNGLTA